jgi:hypothetical protein
VEEANSSFDWTRLLREIRRGHVIPIVGPELLPYHRTLAWRLAEACGVDGDAAEAGIVAVADDYFARERDVDRVYDELETLLDRHDERAPAVEQLLDIAPLRLFLTTDYGSVIEKALARRNEASRSLVFTNQTGSDDQRDYPPPLRTVYHLLGTFERSRSAALARVDQLEHCYGLRGDYAPRDLLQLLRTQKNLLFLGCDFPEWIGGFFTRVLMGAPLYDRKRGIEVVASDATSRSTSGSLTAFLRSNRVDVYEGDAASFVAELHRRYREQVPRSSEPASAEKARGGFAFLSYSRRDLEATRTLARALQQASIDVWFDEKEITPGSDFDKDIQLAIQDASAFVPVLSRASLSADQSYFISEWKSALRGLGPRMPDVPFIFPVIIDDQPQAEAVAALTRRGFEPFAKVHIEPCPKGAVTKRLIDALVEARKRQQRPQSGGV